MEDQARHIQRIKAIIAHSLERGKPFLKALHPADIATILEDVSPETRQRIISLLPAGVAGEALAEMDDHSAPEDILTKLSPEKAAEIIEHLDYDDAADLLAQIPTSELRLIMAKLGHEEERVLNDLMRYDEETAGGIMNPEVLRVREDMDKAQALDEVIRFSEESEHFYAIYVVDAEGRLLGTVPLKKLIAAKHGAHMSELVKEEVVSVHVDTDQERVANVMKQYNLPAIPVVDDQGKLLGRVTFDDVMDIMEEESTEDILSFAGVSEAESLRGSIFNAVRSRLPWLLVNLGTALFAGYVISLFQNTIERLVIITSYMPIIAGVAGNGATQSLAVTIRRLATDTVLPREYFQVIFKEFGVGVINGLIIGSVISLAAVLMNQNEMLGLVVFIAMISNMLVAGIVGSTVPLLLQRAGVDPAVASSIFITAFTDILGFTLLLGLASWILL
jgi:magnesium transporter